MNIAILGCGPAGLIAAAAASSMKCSVTIFSKKRKSEMFGTQYLHMPIPGVTDTDPVLIHYNLIGSADAYREKVYGVDWSGRVSPEDLVGEHEGWDIRRTYDKLWHDWQLHITDQMVTTAFLFGLLDSQEFGLVINSIPRQSICRTNHWFKDQLVWALGDAPERGIFVPFDIAPNTVECSGHIGHNWYRRSNVFGYKSIEWPCHDMGKPAYVLDSAALIHKPIHHECTCWLDAPTPVVHVGRYGQWKKDVLSHTAYGDTIAAISEKLGVVAP